MDKTRLKIVTGQIAAMPMRTVKFLQGIPKILGSSLRTEAEKYLQDQILWCYGK